MTEYEGLPPTLKDWEHVKDAEVSGSLPAASLSLPVTSGTVGLPSGFFIFLSSILSFFLSFLCAVCAV